MFLREVEEGVGLGGGGVQVQDERMLRLGRERRTSRDPKEERVKFEEGDMMELLCLCSGEKSKPSLIFTCSASSEEKQSDNAARVSVISAFMAITPKGDRI
jgi:hypothetical protein